MRDVALVWRNCTQYNHPGSAIDKLREKVQKAFEEAWQRAQLPLAPAPGTSSCCLLPVKQVADRWTWETPERCQCGYCRSCELSPLS